MQDRRRGPGVVSGAEPGAGHNNPPVTPENLIDVDALPALLAENYGLLVGRQGELQAAVERWKALHLIPRRDDWPEGKAWPTLYKITAEADSNRTSDFLRHIAAFAGGRTPSSGEVDEARQKVKRAPWDACKVIDAWFNDLRGSLRADMELIDKAQTLFLQEKQAAEHRERHRVSEAAAEAARQAQAAAMAAKGADEETAAAIIAEEQAAVAQRRAAAPPQDMVRSTSQGGTTTTLRSNWKWQLTSKTDLLLSAAGPAVFMALLDIPEIAGDPKLQRKIRDKLVSDNPVPLDWITTADSQITAALRSASGRRQVPGLEIFDDARAARTGRTA